MVKIHPPTPTETPMATTSAGCSWRILRNSRSVAESRGRPPADEEHHQDGVHGGRASRTACRPAVSPSAARAPIGHQQRQPDAEQHRARRTRTTWPRATKSDRSSAGLAFIEIDDGQPDQVHEESRDRVDHARAKCSVRASREPPPHPNPLPSAMKPPWGEGT